MHELVKRPLNAAMEEVSEEQLGQLLFKGFRTFISLYSSSPEP
jgi:hypothetical protein